MTIMMIWVHTKIFVVDIYFISKATNKDDKKKVRERKRNTQQTIICFIIIVICCDTQSFKYTDV